MRFKKIGLFLATALWLASDGAASGQSALPNAIVEGISGTLTGPELYDESINFAPQFSVWQIDPRLSDLFGSQGQSELCWPTSLAHRMAYDKFWRQPSFPDIKLVTDPAHFNLELFNQVRGRAPGAITILASASFPGRLPAISR